MCNGARLGEVGGPTKYLETKSKQVYTVDHKDMKVVGAPETAPADGADEGARAAVDAALAEYVGERYVEGTAAAAAYASGAGQLSLVVSGEKLNLRNFWSGQFLSTWTVALAAGGPTVSGEIKIRAHYFEEGNVQLQSKKAVAAQTLAVDAGDAAAVAAAVKELVATEERLLQEGLEEMYSNMTDETFKAMRRVMPVHRNKMNWNINEVKLNANLQGGKESAKLKPLK